MGPTLWECLRVIERLIADPDSTAALQAARDLLDRERLAVPFDDLRQLAAREARHD